MRQYNDGVTAPTLYCCRDTFYAGVAETEDASEAKLIVDYLNVKQTIVTRKDGAVLSLLELGLD